MSGELRHLGLSDGFLFAEMHVGLCSTKGGGKGGEGLSDLGSLKGMSLLIAELTAQTLKCP